MPASSSTGGSRSVTTSRPSSPPAGTTSLIPDEYLIAEYFQPEADAIEALEATIAEAQGELSEAVETALEVSGYEPDEDEKVTAAVIKKALKALIDDLKDSAGASAKKELKNLTDQDKAIVNGGVKRDHRGGVKREPLGGCELVPVVHGRDLWAHGVQAWARWSVHSAAGSRRWRL